MNPTTAFCFILAGATFLNTPLFRLPTAIFLITTGTLILSRSLFGLSIHIDRFFFAPELGLIHTTSANVMAPNTAFNCFLIGLALLLLDLEFKRRYRPSQFLALISAFISLLAITGYAYQVKNLYGVAAFIPMALNTAVCFGLVCIGVLCSRPDRGLMRELVSLSPGGVIARRLLPAAIIIPLILGWVILLGERAQVFTSELGASLFSVTTSAIFTVNRLSMFRFSNGQGTPC